MIKEPGKCRLLRDISFQGIIRKENSIIQYDFIDKDDFVCILGHGTYLRLQKEIDAVGYPSLDDRFLNHRTYEQQNNKKSEPVNHQRYEYEPEVTKAGYRPLKEHEWKDVVVFGTVITDVNQGDRRVRVLERGGHWFCWSMQGTVHTCFELTDEETLLPYDKYKMLRYLFEDIERFGREE